MWISVEKPILRINHSSTFMVTDLAGQIQPLGHLGIFSDDTRFLSYYACYAEVMLGSVLPQQQLLTMPPELS
jgi:hypothetical protein